LTISVFLVEDMQPLRALVSELLSTVGDFRVVGMAATEAEARLWLDENPQRWEFAIVDLVLEQGTGMGVIARCRAAAPDAKIVVFSDYATPGIRKHCLKLGADAVFQKGQDLAAFTAYCGELAGPAEGRPSH
jgi:DNA-binding NarL/FixJ family response regulator